MQPVQVSAENGIMALQYSYVPCQWVLTAVQRGQDGKDMKNHLRHNFNEYLSDSLSLLVPGCKPKGLIESLLWVRTWVRTYVRGYGTQDLGNRSNDFSEILHEVGGK